MAAEAIAVADFPVPSGRQFFRRFYGGKASFWRLQYWFSRAPLLRSSRNESTQLLVGLPGAAAHLRCDAAELAVLLAPPQGAARRLFHWLEPRRPCAEASWNRSSQASGTAVRARGFRAGPLRRTEGGKCRYVPWRGARGHRAGKSSVVLACADCEEARLDRPVGLQSSHLRGESQATKNRP